METRRREQTEKSPVVMEVSVREYLSNSGNLPPIKLQWEYCGLIKRLSRMPRMIVCVVCVWFLLLDSSSFGSRFSCAQLERDLRQHHVKVTSATSSHTEGKVSLLGA